MGGAHDNKVARRRGVGEERRLIAPRVTREGGRGRKRWKPGDKGRRRRGE